MCPYETYSVGPLLGNLNRNRRDVRGTMILHALQIAGTKWVELAPARAVPTEYCLWQTQTRSPYENEVVVRVVSIESRTFFTNLQYFIAKKVLGPILTNTFFHKGCKYRHMSFTGDNSLVHT